MIKSSYYDYIYEVSGNGETIKLRPEKIFDPTGVYLIVDKELKIIWIWAGSHSRLFHRYMAANWAGKLKTKKKFYNFKYEVVKQGLEPLDFKVIHNEIKENKVNLNYPGQSRNDLASIDLLKPAELESTNQIYQQKDSHSDIIISRAVKSQIKKILSEIKEMQLHVKYSINHIQQRFDEIEKLLDK